MRESTESDVVTIPELSSAWKVHRNTILQWIQRGEFPGAFQESNRWRIPRADVDAYIKRSQAKCRASTAG